LAPVLELELAWDVALGSALAGEFATVLALDCRRWLALSAKA
jgi:hypothetical protein